jgi:hypothetical protein
MPPGVSELRPTSEREFIPGEPKNNMLGDTSKVVEGVTNRSLLSVALKRDKLLSSADRRNGFMVVVRPKPRDVMPLNGEKAIGFTNGVVGNVTLKPGGKTVFRPGGNKDMDPFGSNDAFRAACSRSMNRMVGDRVVVFVNGLAPGMTFKFLLELAIITVPAGRTGFV